MSASATPTAEVLLRGPSDLAAHLPRWEAFVTRRGPAPLSYHPAWPSVLAEGLGHSPYWVEAVEGGETRGLLPLAFVRSFLFGRFLVGLPYLNYGGVMAEDEEVARHLVDRAVELAGRLDVRRLELRHEHALDHPHLTTRAGHKVHMRLSLAATAEELWKRLKPPVRNQIRKGQRSGLDVSWGGEELLPAFYDVFSRNMRDLGTPVYPVALFRAILSRFGDRAEIAVVRVGHDPVAAGLLLHGWGITEVPSASSLRYYNYTCANMLLYWSFLERAVRRGQAIFDLGRSSPESSTFRFKKQWGAEPCPAEWQYVFRGGDAEATNREAPRYRRLIWLWRRLPEPITRRVGPAIVRGIP